MDLIQWLAVILFTVSLIAIVFEHHLLMPKAAISLSLAFALWIMRRVQSSGVDTEAEVMEAAAEVVGIFLFLFAAMFLVEVLRHYRFFDLIRKTLYARGYRDRKQFLVICLITFFLSAVLDNLTTTLVMVTVAERFFTGRNRVVTAIAIVVAANAGGAFSPIGDVTTIMLWVEGKFSASQVVINTFFPSFVSFAVTTYLLSRLIVGDTVDSREEINIRLENSEKMVIIMSLGCFALPLVATMIDLPPFLGLLGGLGFVWLVVHHLKHRSSVETHIQADIGLFLKEIEYEALAFFAGILLAVNALNSLGVLEEGTRVLLGSNPSDARIVIGMIGLGWLSAFVDNVPLTALAIDSIPTKDTSLWSLLAFTVGTGGSHLAIGSAAGIVAMSKVKELTSTVYLKLGTISIAIGFLAACAVWFLQFSLM